LPDNALFNHHSPIWFRPGLVSGARLDQPNACGNRSGGGVVATVRQTLAMFDRRLEDAREELSICNMDGRKIDPDRLRSLVDDEQGPCGIAVPGRPFRSCSARH
jgi:hypothetical protein